ATPSRTAARVPGVSPGVVGGGAAGRVVATGARDLSLPVPAVPDRPSPGAGHPAATATVSIATTRTHPRRGVLFTRRRYTRIRRPAFHGPGAPGGRGAVLALRPMIVSGGASDRARDLVTKRRGYAAAGIPAYWSVD